MGIYFVLNTHFNLEIFYNQNNHFKTEYSWLLWQRIWRPTFENYFVKIIIKTKNLKNKTNFVVDIL